jgi:hypothetical protein
VWFWLIIARTSLNHPARDRIAPTRRPHHQMENPIPPVCGDFLDRPAASPWKTGVNKPTREGGPLVGGLSIETVMM